MKKKIFAILFAGVLVLAACTPAAEVVEEAPAVAEEEAMEKEDDAAMEESSDEGAMEESSDEEAMEKESHDDDAMEAKTEVSFSMDIWPVIEKFALNAHGGSGGIFLESYEDILQQVVPGKPEESMLYRVLIADGVPQMPPTGPLPDETIQLFYDWIAQGAPNN